MSQVFPESLKLALFKQVICVFVTARFFGKIKSLREGCFYIFVNERSMKNVVIKRISKDSLSH